METILCEFARYLRSVRGLREGSIKAYLRYCRDVKRFNRTIPWALMERKHIEAWLTDRHERGRGVNGNHVAFYAVSHFFRYLRRQGVVAKNPAEDIELPKVQRTLPSFLSEREVQALIKELESIGDDMIRHRFRCIFLLLYATGLRIHEVVKIRMKDLRIDECTLYLVGKGGQQRWATFCEHAAAALRKYLELRDDWLARHGYTSEYLFPTRHGRPIAAETFRGWMTSWQHHIPLRRRLHPHMLRHTFATHLLEHGANIRIVQELLGHASITSTQIYTHVTQDVARREYARCHPMALMGGVTR